MALSRGAYSAGARSVLMRMRTQCMYVRIAYVRTYVLAFLVRPGAPQRRKICGTSIKIIS